MTAPPVASFNTNPKWPGGYVQVLRDQGIEEGNIPHFLQWVRGLFASPTTRRFYFCYLQGNYKENERVSQASHLRYILNQIENIPQSLSYLS
jgi:hypothetical protein